MTVFFSKPTYMLCFNRKQMKNIVSEWEAKLRQIIQYLLGNNIFCVKTTADICRTMRKEKLDLDSNTYLVTFKTFCYPSKVFENSFAILVWLAFLGPSYVFGVGCNNSLAVSRVDTYFMLRVACCTSNCHYTSIHSTLLQHFGSNSLWSFTKVLLSSNDFMRYLSIVVI